jgi:hypothetical protein
MVTREEKLAKCYNKRAFGSFYKSYSRAHSLPYQS